MIKITDSKYKENLFNSSLKIYINLNELIPKKISDSKNLNNIQISQIQNSQFSIRNLLDSPSVQKVCDSSSKEVKEFFENGGIFITS